MQINFFNTEPILCLFKYLKPYPFLGNQTDNRVGDFLVYLPVKQGQECKPVKVYTNPQLGQYPEAVVVFHFVGCLLLWLHLILQVRA